MMSWTDVAALLGAVLGPTLLVVVALMRYQHLDSSKTRDLIEGSSRENRTLIEGSSRESRTLIEKNRDLIVSNHTEVTRSLGDARERLARIEGRLHIPPPSRHPPSDPADRDDGDNDAGAT